MMRENTTYTRTYPQTSNPQQFTYSPVIRPHSVPDNRTFQQQAFSAGTSQPIRISRITTNQPRYNMFPQHRVFSGYSSQSIKSEKLSHFDYVDTDQDAQYSSSSCGTSNQASLQNRVENEGGSQINHSTFKLNHIPSYSSATQNAIIGHFNPKMVNTSESSSSCRNQSTPNRSPNQKNLSQFHQQPNIISSHQQQHAQQHVRQVISSPQRHMIATQQQHNISMQNHHNIISSSRSHVLSSPQPHMISQQRHTIPSPQLVRTNIHHAPRLQNNNQSFQAHQQLIRLVTSQSPVLNAQIMRTNAGTDQQMRPVMLQMNRGIVQNPRVRAVNPAPNTTHVYLSVPQGSNTGGLTKFIKTPNGNLRPINGQVIQNAQSKMYAVRYALTEGKQKQQQFAICKPMEVTSQGNNSNIVTINNKNIAVAAKPQEKVILPRPQIPAPNATLSNQPADRKRKYVISRPSTPNKYTKVGSAPQNISKPALHSPETLRHNELIQRVTKSLEADREVVQNPITVKPFESFTDAFRKLMKYHIYYEPDCKETYLKKVDKTHEHISQKLLARKQQIQNKLHSYLLEDAARPLPNVRYSLDYITLLSQSVADEQEEVEKLKQELETAKLHAKLGAELGKPSSRIIGSSSDTDNDMNQSSSSSSNSGTNFDTG